MRTIREVLKTIKEIQGIKTDAELAQHIGVPLETMRNWIQNETIRKQLMRYCFDNHISIDEVFFGNPSFSKERCEKCHKKSTCSIYREVQLTPVNIEDSDNEINITTNSKGKSRLVCELYSNDTLKSNFSTDIKDVDKIIFKVGNDSS